MSKNIVGASLLALVIAAVIYIYRKRSLVVLEQPQPSKLPELPPPPQNPDRPMHKPDPHVVSVERVRTETHPESSKEVPFLPTNIWVIVLSSLSASDIKSLRRVNKAFASNSIIQSVFAWKIKMEIIKSLVSTEEKWLNGGPMFLSIGPPNTNIQKPLKVVRAPDLKEALKFSYDVITIGHFIVSKYHTHKKQTKGSCCRLIFFVKADPPIHNTEVNIFEGEDLARSEVSKLGLSTRIAIQEIEDFVNDSEHPANTDHEVKKLVEDYVEVCQNELASLKNGLLPNESLT